MVSEEETPSAIKIAIIKIIAIVLILIPVMYWAHNSGKKIRAELRTETPAQIVSVSYKEGVKNVQDQTTIKHRYVVNGKTFDGEKINLGDARHGFKVGGSAKVCYNASSPAESQVREASYRCGS
jgi:hypothetical protein